MPLLVILSGAYLTEPGIIPVIDREVKATVPLWSFALIWIDPVEKLVVTSTESVKAA